MKKYSSGVFLVVAFIVGVGVVSAQAQQSTDVSFGPDYSNPPEGTVSCFDYYRFGSVQVSLDSFPGVVTPGESTVLQAEVRNDNTYPVVDVAVYARILREQEVTTHEDATNVTLNGGLVTDQFFVARSLDIDAKASKNIMFNWQAPEALAPGTYTIAFYTISGDKFNLGGLSFTDDVIGTKQTFFVEEGSLTVPTEWSKNEVTINGNAHNFAKPIPVFGNDETISITAPLINKNSTTENVEVIWKVYSWDAMQESNLISETTESVVVPAEGTKKIEFTIPANPKGTVTYVIGEAKASKNNSYINVRFAREKNEQMRLNFPALTQFPIQSGDTAQMFSCLHSASPIDLDGTLILTLSDAEGRKVAESKYDGRITSAMMGYVDSFTAPRTLNKAVLSAVLMRDGVEVERSDMVYDCESIDPESCLPVLSETVADTSVNANDSTLLLSMTIALFSLILLAIALYLRRKNMNTESKKVEMHIPVQSLVFVVLCGLTLGFSIHVVEAGSVTWSTVGRSSVLYNDVSGGYLTTIGSQINNMNIDVTYNDIPKRSDGSALNNNSTVSQGDVLIYDVPHANADIFWTSTGSHTDSPTGYWNEWPDGYACHIRDAVVSANGNTSFLLGSKVIVQKPRVTMQNSTGMNCTESASTTVSTQFSCTVTATTGTVIAKVDFAATPGSANLERGSYYAISGGAPTISPPPGEFITPTSTVWNGTSGSPGNQYSVGCFTAGTQITLADGSTKSIEDITVEDSVRTSSGSEKVVGLKTYETKGILHAFNGSENYFVTSNHPFMTKEGWKAFDPERARKETPGEDINLLQVGDEVLREDGTYMKIESVETKYYDAKTVYNFEVANAHEYYADGFLVHNLPAGKDILP